MEFVINRSLVKVIEQVIDDDGSIKDSAVCSISHTSFLYIILHVVLVTTYSFSLIEMAWYLLHIDLFDILHNIVLLFTKRKYSKRCINPLLLRYRYLTVNSFSYCKHLHNQNLHPCCRVQSLESHVNKCKCLRER
jgi:hypothetical protein